MIRSLSVAIVALGAALAHAQFDGPAPLAWRWLPPSGVAASGSPLVNGDTIYEACGGRIYAIDRATGNKKWQYPAEDPIPGNFRTAPILVAGVLVGTGDNKIMYGIDPVTGAPKWSFVMPGAPLGQPIGVDKYVVQAQSDNKLVAVDPSTGQTFWKNADSGDTQGYTVADGLYGQIASTGSSILYFTSKNELHSVDIVTRLEDAWARPVKFTQLDPAAQPLVYGGSVYVSSGQFLVSINPLTGVPVWQTPTGFQTAFSPTASAQGVFVCSKDGTAMLYDLTSGQPTAGMPTPVVLGSYPVTRPSAVGDKFLVPTTSGAIDLIDPTNGNTLWSYVIRPIGVVYASQPNSGGGQFGPGPRGGGGGNTAPQEITEIQASGPAVLDGGTLLVPARDSSLLAFDRDLGVDLTPPTVQMLFPNPGDQVAGVPPLLLYLKVRDEGSGVDEKSIKVSIDSRPYEYKYKRDGSVTVNFSSQGKNRPLGDGRHQVSLEASDWLGNKAKSTFALTIDNSLPPVRLPGQADQTSPFGGGGKNGGGGAGGGSGGLGGGD